jgi:sulfur carrier protein
MINIVVNGKDFTFNKQITILDLLKELKIEDKVMAVAIDMEIVKKDKWQETKVENGNKIEFLHFVGGG